MLNILVGHAGVVFSVRSAAELLPEVQREELAMAREILGGVRCPFHGEPTGTVHLGFEPLSVEVDDPCCARVVKAVQSCFEPKS